MEAGGGQVSERTAENDVPERTCPICYRTERVDIEPGQFGMEMVTFHRHYIYVSDEYRSSLCRSAGVKHVQPAPIPPEASDR